MSTYKKVTRHPQTGKYELATWHDDYFGHHMYGVEFESDAKVYPVDIVQPKQLETFWVEDVKAAFHDFMRFSSDKTLPAFLNCIEDQYKARWERDPVGGEGAVDWLQRLLPGIAVKRKAE